MQREQELHRNRLVVAEHIKVGLNVDLTDGAAIFRINSNVSFSVAIILFINAAACAASAAVAVRFACEVRLSINKFALSAIAVLVLINNALCKYRK